MGLYRGRSEAFAKKWQELAEWFLEHQTALDYDEPEIEDLATAIDTAVDNWFGEARAKASEAAADRVVDRIASDPNVSPTYRAALRDAGRGHLLR